MFMMADTSHDSAFAPSNVLQHLKKEIDEKDLLTQQCEDFQVSNIKMEKMEEEQSFKQQSDNCLCAQTSDSSFGHQESAVKLEIEMNDFTTNKPWTFASKLLEVSMKADNSLCPVPIIMPDFKLHGHMPVPEVSMSQQVYEIESEKELTLENCALTKIKEEDKKQNLPNETSLLKESPISFCQQTENHQSKICLKEFTQSCNLKKHQQIHTGEKPFKCQICLKEFTKSRNLKKHQRIHTGEKPFECQICLKKFLESSGFKRHQRIHTGEKPFKCQICLKEFTQSYDLKKHQQIHTGEKPFKCQICLKEFSQSQHLKKHQQTHNGKKPLKYQICLKEFLKSSGFKRHQQIHTGEKPLKCQICLIRFSRPQSLKRHQLIHTGEKPSNGLKE